MSDQHELEERVKTAQAECERLRASIHGLFMHVAEKIAGCSKRLGEYPTLSATSGIPTSHYTGLSRASAMPTAVQRWRSSVAVFGHVYLTCATLMLE
jgi:hypothetical protein